MIKVHINAVNSFNVSFCKAAELKVEDNKNATKGPSCLKKIADATTKPIKDSFHKKYGDDVEPNAKIVADFVSDGLITGAVVGLGTFGVFKKMKNSTNGLTGKLIEATSASDNKNVFRIVGGALNEIRADSLAYRSRVAQEGKSIFGDLVHGESSIPSALHEKIKEICMAKDNFNPNSGLGKTIKTIFGEKTAIKIGRGLADVGIADGYDLIDSSIALSATLLASRGLDEASKGVTEKDDEELANASRLRVLAKKAGDVIDVGVKIFGKLDEIKGE